MTDKSEGQAALETAAAALKHAEAHIDTHEESVRHVISAWLAALSRWQMVPKEANGEILGALYGPFLSLSANESRRQGWRDAIAAAPPPPGLEDSEDSER